MTSTDLERPSAVITVLTFRRNHDLLVAIPPLLREAQSVTPPATVLVIDNDPDRGAQPVLAPLVSDHVRYVHEPEPGIAAARNRAMREATNRFLVFIDDDMHPETGWLNAMLRTQRATGAAVVAGPVFPEYEAEPDPWINAGRFFVRRRMPTGTPLAVAASGNMLLDLEQIDAVGLRFDARFGLRGGSDYMFTSILARRGVPMVWCDEAVAFDRVPVVRMTHRWVLRRAFRSGNSQILVSLALCDSRMQRWAVRVRATVGGIARIVAGVARAGSGVIGASVVHRARGRRLQHRGAGMLVGAFGHSYVEYARSEVGESRVLDSR